MPMHRTNPLYLILVHTNMSFTSFTEELRAAAGDQWERVVNHKFTTELASGKIDRNGKKDREHTDLLDIQSPLFSLVNPHCYNSVEEVSYSRSQISRCICRTPCGYHIKCKEPR